jgi:transposase InsO family protein
MGEPEGWQPPPSPVDLLEMAAAQQSCADCQRGATSPALRILRMDVGPESLLVDCSSGVLRPLVPAAFRRQIFNAVHDLAHPGARATRHLVSSRFVWPGLASDISQWCKDCQFCQRAKPSPRPKSAVQPIAVPIQRFSHVHVDLVGPLPSSADGFAYLLTAIDRSTHWAEAIPLKATSATDCAEAFISGWVARFGVPATLTSDRGVQFTSSFWSAVMSRLGVRHNTTTAFHPQSNGMVERFHRRLKEALKVRAAS